MQNRQSNIASVVLTVMLIVAVLAVIAEQVVIGNAQSELDTTTAQLSNLQSQVEDAQSTNETLTASYSDDIIEWRNAQGRLSFLGDGSGKVAYLTFDDGPDDTLTPKIMEILEEYGINATWFCLANDEEQDYLALDMCAKLEKAGNVVGIHDWEQNESYDYYKGSVDNYFDTDFDKTREKLEAAVGHEIKIMRFAGGSPTIGYYNSKIATKLPQEMITRGYQYFDWNVLAGDSEPSQFVNGSTPKATIVNNVLGGAKTFAASDSPICVLMHDNPGKDTTVEALPEIIEGLQNLGYTFATLSYDSPGFYQLKIIDD